MRQPAEYLKLWHDINRELWRCAVNQTPPRPFIRAELWRRVDHAKHLEKNAAIRMMRTKSPPCAIFKACCWIVESGVMTPNGTRLPDDSALAPENAAIPAVWPQSYPGVDISQNATQNTPQTDHYEFLVQAFVYAAQAATLAGLQPNEIDFQIDFSQNRWAVEGTQANPFAQIRVNFFYITAPPKIWNAIFAAIVRHHPPSRQIAERYVRSVEAQTLLAVYSDISPLKVHDVYDLSQMFDEINAEYFNNAIPKPILAWTTRPNFRTLGTYNFHWDTICISRILNDQRVPENAVRFILYHEMLHIKHGLHRVSGRALAHTPEFRADEARFPNRDEIENTLRKLREIVKN